MSRFKAAAQNLERITMPWLRLIGGISTAILVVMMLVTVIDASGRRLFGRPIAGTYEFVSFLLCLLFFGSIVYSGLEKNHLSIVVLTSRFPIRARKVVSGIGRLLSSIFTGMISWRLILSALNEKAAGTTGMQLTSVPLYPFIFVGALGMAILCWIFLLEAIQLLGSASEKNI
jgi:TRAP-type C4-dicarboxylate transport system permease small subunit